MSDKSSHFLSPLEKAVFAGVLVASAAGGEALEGIH